jgi:hypothetical protein
VLVRCPTAHPQLVIFADHISSHGAGNGHPRYRPNIPLSLSSTLSIGMLGTCNPELCAANFFSYSDYVLSIIRCALIDDYVAYYLPIGCRRHDLVRSFTTLTKLLKLLLDLVLSEPYSENTVWSVFIGSEPWVWDWWGWRLAG